MIFMTEKCSANINVNSRKKAKLKMQKFARILIIAFVIIASFVLCACSANNPPETIEYYEIEYQDGSGVHKAKAIQSLLIEDIKIYITQMTGNVTSYTKWEYSDMLYFYFDKGVEEAVGGFASASSQQSFGYISLYYGEELQEEHYEWWTEGYYYLNPAEVAIGASFNVENKNITIDGQPITSFAISSFSSTDTEFCVSAIAGSTIVKTENIRIGIKVAYPASATWQNITLIEDGDFTAIMRNGVAIATIRTENILGKVRL